MTPKQKKSIEAFIDYYLTIIDYAYSIKPRVNKEKKINFYKCNKYWGTILMDYNDTLTTKEEKKKMWADIINIDRVSKEFMNTIWNGLAKGDRQNTTREGITVRLERIKVFYQNKVIIAAEHGIKWRDE